MTCLLSPCGYGGGVADTQSPSRRQTPRDGHCAKVATVIRSTVYPVSVPQSMRLHHGVVRAVMLRVAPSVPCFRARNQKTSDNHQPVLSFSCSASHTISSYFYSMLAVLYAHTSTPSESSAGWDSRGHTTEPKPNPLYSTAHDLAILGLRKRTKRRFSDESYCYLSC